MKQIVIFGTGAIAEVIYKYLINDSTYEVAAFSAHERFIKEKKLFQLPIIAFEEIQKMYPPDKFGMFVAVGYANVNQLRASIYNEAKAKGYKLISYVNSKAIYWSDVEIGDNCFIFEDNVIQPFVEIGNNVIIWSGNHIGHHASIGDHCFISSHVVISGHVHIEPYCFLGVNSTLINGLKIAQKCVVGAGTLLIKDTQESGVYVGSPARLINTDSSTLARL